MLITAQGESLVSFLNLNEASGLLPIFILSVQ